MVLIDKHIIILLSLILMISHTVVHVHVKQPRFVTFTFTHTCMSKLRDCYSIAKCQFSKCSCWMHCIKLICKFFFYHSSAQYLVVENWSLTLMLIKIFAAGKVENNTKMADVHIASFKLTFVEGLIQEQHWNAFSFLFLFLFLPFVVYYLVGCPEERCERAHLAGKLINCEHFACSQQKDVHDKTPTI